MGGMVAKEEEDERGDRRAQLDPARIFQGRPEVDLQQRPSTETLVILGDFSRSTWRRPQ
ncbi:hypothetical protein AXF42_Ash000205 [Apostasia shenzhenica]|uniref:Uncharacterized protein n=1 Tax=Apostasia shenzhenica TaxID=1088818 RepID=A0A2I0AFP7_9ASPA|nr:hypothetical protein AXF42_Ash000205 [Apostasia shenzhenica]